MLNRSVAAVSRENRVIRKMSRKPIAAAFAILALNVFSCPQAAETPPQFKVDPFWPQTLPNNWALGEIAGLAVDSKNHVWVIQRDSRLPRRAAFRRLR
jgi:hypothetical protein